MKCPFYDDWDYACRVEGDLCYGDENNAESCDVYMDTMEILKKDKEGKDG